jgi:hypothetical protein
MEGLYYSNAEMSTDDEPAVQTHKAVSDIATRMQWEVVNLLA